MASMPQRARKQTEFVSDSSCADDTDLYTHLLGSNDFNRYVKMCFHGTTAAVDQLKQTAAAHLERIGVKPNLSKGISKCPEEASNNYNLQSLYAWMVKLEKSHKKAVGQLIELHATACRRLGV